MPETRVYLHGAGLHTALGRGVDENLSALRDRCVNTVSVELGFEETPTMVPFFQAARTEIGVSRERVEGLIEGVVSEALRSRDLSARELEETHLFVGSTSFDVPTIEHELRSRDAGESVLACLVRNLRPLDEGLGDFIRGRFGMGGDTYTFGTACTASTSAFLYASHLLQAGLIPRALVVGLEFFNQTSLLGFQSLGLVATGGFRPFTPGRNGLILGEGCSALVLETSRPPEERPFYFSGGSSLCDTYSMTTTRVDGSQVTRVMTEALAQAKLDPAEIAAVKGHGTASLTNDEAESSGLREVFSSCPPLSLLKPYIGHTLGACGLSELILFCRSVQEGRIPSVPYAVRPDPELGIAPLAEDLELDHGYFMLNSFGFGGNNASVVVGNV